MDGQMSKTCQRRLPRHRRTTAVCLLTAFIRARSDILKECSPSVARVSAGGNQRGSTSTNARLRLCRRASIARTLRAVQRRRRRRRSRICVESKKRSKQLQAHHMKRSRCSPSSSLLLRCCRVEEGKGKMQGQDFLITSSHPAVISSSTLPFLCCSNIIFLTRLSHPPQCSAVRPRKSEGKHNG